MAPSSQRPSTRPSTFIALLRGINVGGKNLLPMAELRALCAGLGWEGVQTYIQSGNVVFRARTPRATLEQALERAIARRFDLAIPVIVRAARDWPALLAGNPFPEAARKEPNAVMVALSRRPPPDRAAAGVLERAVNGERVRQVGDVLWIHYARGVAKSKLSPGLLDRLVGSPVTTRNWRTALKLEELAGRVGP
jgi:uncharacterized protein (DUF1697 family)